MDGTTTQARRCPDEERLTLARQLHGSRGLAREAVLDVVTSIAEQLDQAADAGILHGNVSPDTIFLTPSGEDSFCAELCEFGAGAQPPLLEDGDPTASRPAAPSELPYTIETVAPEVVTAAHPVGRRADIYSLGCVTWHMLCGSPPFSAAASQTIAVLLAHAQAPPPELPPGVPTALRDPLHRALAMDPQDRYATASAFAADIRSALAAAAVADPETAGGGSTTWGPDGPAPVEDPDGSPDYAPTPSAPRGARFAREPDPVPASVAVGALPSHAAAVRGSAPPQSAPFTPVDRWLGSIPGPGDRIAGRRLGRTLGAGLYSRVYSADDGQSVVKLLEAPTGARTLEARLASLTGPLAFKALPGVVVPLERGTVGAAVWVATHAVDGSTLQRELACGPLDPGVAARTAKAIAAALDATAALGVAHGDLKPSNVLLDSDGTVWVTDFCHRIAQVTSRGSATFILDREQEWISAPETTPSHAADIYALGCLLMWMLTGTPPFPGEALDIAVAHRTAPVPRATERVDDLPAGIDDVLARALAKDPQRRYPTAGALAADVLDVLS